MPARRQLLSASAASSSELAAAVGAARGSAGAADRGSGGGSDVRDLVVALPTSPARRELVWASGSWRKGVRTLVLTNVSAEEAGAGSGTPNEVWATFPDNLPGASKTPGDSRAAMAGVMAYRTFGKTFNWVLQGDDDTVWFLPAVQRLVAQLDPQQPYLLTDCYWDKFKQGQIGVCALNEPRCIPCHVNTEGKNLTALRVVKTCGTPCTRELMCEAFKAEYGKAMGRDCRRPPINFVHGGAGQILSIGLLRRLKLREFEKCVRSRAYKTCHSSDCIFTRCMWAQGWGYTDPGFTVEHPGTIRTLFDPWRGLSMTQQLREVSLGQTAGACGVECQAGLPHMVSNHLVLRAATQPHEAALLMRELVDAYEFWDAVRTGRTLSRRRRRRRQLAI